MQNQGDTAAENGAKGYCGEKFADPERRETTDFNITITLTSLG